MNFDFTGLYEWFLANTAFKLVCIALIIFISWLFIRMFFLVIQMYWFVFKMRESKANAEKNEEEWYLEGFTDLKKYLLISTYPITKKKCFLYNKLEYIFKLRNNHKYVDIRDILREEVFYSYFKSKLLLFLINSFITLGILYTFIGLVSGLSIDTESTILIEKSINTLLSGAQFAFNSSIIGIILSLVGLLIYKLISTFLFENALYNFQDELSYAFPELNGDSQLGTLIDSVKSYIEVTTDRHLDAVDRIIDKILDGLEDKMSVRFERFGEVITTQTSAVEKSVYNLSELVDGQKSIMIELRDVMKGLNTSFQTYSELNDNIEHNLTSFNQKLIDNTNGLTTMSKDFNDVVNQFNNVSQNSLNLQRVTLDRVMELQQQFVNHFTALSDDLKTTSSSNTKVINGIIETTNTISNNILKLSENQSDSISKFIESTEILSNNMESASKKQDVIFKSFASSTENLVEFLKESTEENKELFKNTIQSINSVSNKFSDNIDKINQQQDEMLNTYISSTDTVVEKLNSVSDVNKQLLDASINSINNSINKSMDVYASHVELLDKSVRRVQEVSNKIQKVKEYV